jgi:hypothetical protein
MSDTLWLSADECNEMLPDHDYGSTIGNLETQYGISTQLKCWQLEEVPTPQIDPVQLIDDPDDHEGHAKAESIRQSFRTGALVPPVIIIHWPSDDEHPYVLIEGRHRYNAAHRERIGAVTAWVAHIGCCGGPAGDR